MEIHFQTTDHVVAVEKVAEQHIGTKYFKCNSLRDISDIIIFGKSAVGREVPIRAILRWYLRDLVIKRSRAHLEIAQAISRWSCSNSQ